MSSLAKLEGDNQYLEPQISKTMKLAIRSRTQIPTDKKISKLSSTYFNPNPRNLLVILAIFICANALLFNILVTNPVFDELHNLRDIDRYARAGITYQAITEHINPAGPASYAYIGIIGSMIGNDLFAFRIAVLISAFLSFTILLINRSSSWQNLAPALFLLVNPYTLLASSTLLTELPAIMFVLAGFKLWCDGLKDHGSKYAPLKLIVGGLLIGLSITARQYYIATLPALGLSSLYWLKKTERFHDTKSIMTLACSGVAATIPIMILIFIWNGFTAPAIRNGLSYQQHKVDIGLDLLRPINALLYIGLFAVLPLVFQKYSRRTFARIILISSLIALLLGTLAPVTSLWCPIGPGCGPISQIAWKFEYISEILGLFANVTFVGIAVAGLILLVINIREGMVAKDSGIEPLFAVFILFFFVVEQAFVGGTLAFFERYNLQIAPLIGIALSANNRLSVVRAILPSGLLVSQGIFRLWRYGVAPLYG